MHDMQPQPRIHITYLRRQLETMAGVKRIVYIHSYCPYGIIHNYTHTQRLFASKEQETELPTLHMCKVNLYKT